MIAVGAGKGGVGKTTVAVNLAVALALRGSRVGLLDGDIYGPNVPLMLGLQTQLTTDGRKILPAEKHGIQVVSMGFLTNDDAAVIWRGPMLHGAIQQFFREVAWDALDFSRKPVSTKVTGTEASEKWPISVDWAFQCSTWAATLGIWTTTVILISISGRAIPPMAASSRI